MQHHRRSDDLERADYIQAVQSYKNHATKIVSWIYFEIACVQEDCLSLSASPFTADVSINRMFSFPAIYTTVESKGQSTV